jgi:hypothetical protein
VFSKQDAKDFAKMGRVRPELWRVVYSHLTDDQAAERVGQLVRSDPQAARVTLRYVHRTMEFARGYDTDRAYRIMVAAISRSRPEPVRAQDAERFERERELGWLPLDQAFAVLLAAVPELAELRARAEELAASPEAFGIAKDADSGVLTFPSGVKPTGDRLVGPDSRHPDPLIRSWLAASVLANYLIAVVNHSADRALFEWAQPTTRVTFSMRSA